MKYRKISEGMYRGLSTAQTTAASLLIVLGATLRADPEQWKAKSVLAGTAVQTAHEVGWAALPLLALVSGAAGLVKRKFGQPWLWRALHHFLSVFRDDAFEHLKGDPEFHHRVTLFKHKKWRPAVCRWPWTGWLVAVERSGHITHNRTICYKAPDSPDQAEGIAGRAWAGRQIVLVENLPDQANEFRTPIDVSTYARQTYVSEEWVKERRPSSRSICGIPVEVNGKPWGVIVLDSRHPQGIRNSEAIYRTFSKYIGKLVERL